MLPRKHLNHETPHWITSDADYFITICALPRGQNHLCHLERGARILDTVRLYNEKQFWHCDLALLMPDHVHLLVSFPPDCILSKVVGMWKRSVRREHAITWQRNFFEHRMRKEENIQTKADYILHNPVRAGLVARSQDWPYIWMPKGTADESSAATN